MSILFNGTNGYFSAGDNLDFGSGVSRTVMAWIRLGAINVRNQIVNKQAGSAATGYELCILSSNILEIGVFNGTSYLVGQGSTTLSVDTTYHVCGTYNGASFFVYINGVVDGSSSPGITGSTNSQALQIGTGSPYGSAIYFNGYMEDVRIYNRAVSADEVSTIYEARGNDKIISGLVGHWPMTGGAPTTAPGTIQDRSNSKFSTTASGTLSYQENIALQTSVG
jgi:Concanavalin A-like lectin/glucanases superfamily